MFSLKNTARTVRSIPLLNKGVRQSLKAASRLLPINVRAKLTARWRIHGIFHVNFCGLDMVYYADGDDNIAEALYYGYENLELDELQHFAEFSKRSKVIFDVGANTGIYSVVAGLSNQNSEIHAFEPYDVNARRLAKNLELNELNNINIWDVAVGDKDGGLIKITVPDNGVICDTVSADGQFTEKFYREWINYKEIEVQQIALDEFIKRRRIDHVDLIKIDIENYEESALRGAEKLLREHSPIVFCEIFVDAKKVKFFEEFMRPMGYRCHVIKGETLVQTETLVQSEYGHGRNYVFARKSCRISVN